MRIAVLLPLLLAACSPAIPPPTPVDPCVAACEHVGHDGRELRCAWPGTVDTCKHVCAASVDTGYPHGCIAKAATCSAAEACR